MSILNTVKNAISNDPSLLCDIIAETNLTQTQVTNALYELIKKGDVFKQGIGKNATFNRDIAEVAKPAVAKPAVAEKPTKPAVVVVEKKSAAVITLKELCDAHGVTTTAARRKLRKSTITKPIQGWVWDAALQICHEVTKIITK